MSKTLFSLGGGGGIDTLLHGSFKRGTCHDSSFISWIKLIPIVETVCLKGSYSSQNVDSELLFTQKDAIFLPVGSPSGSDVP